VHGHRVAARKKEPAVGHLDPSTVRRGGDGRAVRPDGIVSTTVFVAVSMTETSRLRPEHSKNRRTRVLAIAGELSAVIDRRLATRRLDCPYIFHRNGEPIGDFRKTWTQACAAIGLAGRLVHDLRRSAVKHLIGAGVDPHTVMEFSGHRTPSMLKLPHHRAARPAGSGGEKQQLQQRVSQGRGPRRSTNRRQRAE